MQVLGLSENYLQLPIYSEQFSLQHPSVSELHLKKVGFKLLSNSYFLAHALRRGCDALRSNIRRSNSLCDLSTPNIPHENFKENSKMASYSCPDLLDLHFLCTLHPLLHKELFSEILTIQYQHLKDVASDYDNSLEPPSDHTSYEELANDQFVDSASATWGGSIWSWLAGTQFSTPLTVFVAQGGESVSTWQERTGADSKKKEKVRHILIL